MNQPLAPGLAHRLLQRVIPRLPQRFRLGRMPYLFLFAMLIIAVVMLYLVITPYPNSRGPYLALIVLLLLMIFQVNRGMSYQWGIHLGTVAALFLLLHGAWTTGGIFSPRLTWMLVLPLTPFFVIGRAAGVAWFGVVLLVYLATGLCNLLGVVPQFGLGAGHVLSSYVTFSMVTLVLVIVPLIYDLMHQAVLAQSRADQRELEARHDALERASLLRERFIASVSRELRTPMTAILGLNALLLSRVEPSSEARKVLTHTRHAADHLMTVIDDILDYSQLQTGRLVAHPEVFRLDELVAHAFELFEPRARNSQLDYRLECDPLLPTWVRTDPHRLMQVLVNLLGNALKFTHQGSVVLRLKWLNPGVLFEVQDSGIGIARERQPLIFERFTQADSGIHARYGGSGLGLAISRQLVQLLQGDIGFESAEGRGSRFWFRLPLQASAPPAQTRAGDAQDKCSPKSSATAWNFLVVDDDALSRDLVAKVLRQAWPQARVFEATDGQQALALLAQAPPKDLVVMDMVMPVLDGIETTARIRREAAWQQLPVIGLTANINPVHLDAFSAAGLSALMLKPFDLQALCQRVEQLLDPHPAAGTDLTSGKSSPGS